MRNTNSPDDFTSELQNRGLGCIQIQRRFELSGYELTGVDYT